MIPISTSEAVSLIDNFLAFSRRDTDSKPYEEIAQINKAYRKAFDDLFLALTNKKPGPEDYEYFGIKYE